MKMVEITISDNRRYTQVALLVDRDDFLLDLEEIRADLKITSFPYILSTYLHPEANNIACAYRDNLMTISGVYTGLGDICFDYHLALGEMDQKIAMAGLFAERIVKKFRLDRAFILVVISAILNNKISDYDLLSTYSLTLDKTSAGKIAQDLEEGVVPDGNIQTIVVNRESTDEDVKRVYKYIKEKIFAKDNKLIKFYDPRGNIRRDREWYWLNKLGMGYKKIWELKMPGNTDSWKGVDMAIKRYKAMLSNGTLGS